MVTTDPNIKANNDGKILCQDTSFILINGRVGILKVGVGNIKPTRELKQIFGKAFSVNINSYDPFFY